MTHVFMRANGRSAMIRTGTTGTITPVSAGYSLSGFSDTTFAFLNKPLSAGKWYWEATVGGTYCLHGVTASPQAVETFGGYSATNAGVYTFGDDVWFDVTWTGATASPWSTSTIVVGGTLGFALDMGAKTLAIYLNGVLGTTISWGSGPTVLYPMFAFQSGASSTVKLRGSHTYTAPAGYEPLQ